MNHSIIPIFIPELACPNQCIFCNQQKISGQYFLPTIADIKNKIDAYIKTIPQNSFVEIAYFGGNFTGLEINKQVEFLKIANEYLDQKLISGIRISTRPDYITSTILDILKQYNVTTIEIGAQSFDDDVLLQSQRGYTSTQIITAATLIKEYDFNLGIQMMIGLPDDSLEKTIYTATQIINLHADNTRIYPLLVIKDTALANLYRTNLYVPLTLEEAIDRVKPIVLLFEDASIFIQKIGLHPTIDLLNGSGIIAGPFHQNFRELVYSAIWTDLFTYQLIFDQSKHLTIECSPKEVNYAAGYQSINKKLLEQNYKSVRFVKNDKLTKRNFNALYN